MLTPSCAGDTVAKFAPPAWPDRLHVCGRWPAQSSPAARGCHPSKTAAPLWLPSAGCRGRSTKSRSDCRGVSYCVPGTRSARSSASCPRDARGDRTQESPWEATAMRRQRPRCTRQPEIGTASPELSAPTPAPEVASATPQLLGTSSRLHLAGDVPVSARRTMVDPSAPPDRCSAEASTSCACHLRKQRVVPHSRENERGVRQELPSCSAAPSSP